MDYIEKFTGKSNKKALKNFRKIYDSGCKRSKEMFTKSDLPVRQREIKV